MHKLSPLRTDAAASDSLGSMLAVAAVVTVVAVVATSVLTPDAPGNALAVEVDAESPPGSTHLLLTRTGGGTVDLGSLAVVVVVDGEVWLDAPAGPGGSTWGLGETLDIELPSAFPEGSAVDVSLVYRPGPERAQVLAEIDVVRGTVRPVPEGPALVSFVGGLQGVAQTRPTENLLATALVVHPDGRKLVLAVEGDLPGLSSPIAMRDDGTGGDQVAGDGTYAGYFTVPVDALPGSYPLLITANDAHGGSTTGLSWVEVVEPAPPPTQAELATPPDPEPAPEAGAPEAGSPDAGAPAASGPEASAPTSTSTSGTPTTTSSSTPTTTSSSAPDPTTSTAPPPAPSFHILPSGGVTPLCDADVTLRVLGTAITYGAGGPPIPVRVDWTTNNGGALQRLWNGRAVAEGDSVTFPRIPSGAVLGVKSYADYGNFHAAYASFVADPHVRVLKNGDPAPYVPGFAGQKPIEDFLKGYVVGGKITLAPNEVIILYEFNPNLQTSAADYQDLVLLLQFPSASCPTVVPPGQTAVLFPGTSNLPCAELPGPGGWSELKIDRPRGGTFTNGELSVTISNFDTKRFDWTSAPGVDAVYVKGGSAGSYYYRYDPEAARGNGLTTPGEAVNAISHISFCYDLP